MKLHAIIPFENSLEKYKQDSSFVYTRVELMNYDDENRIKR